MEEFFIRWGGWILGASVLMFVASLWFASWLIIRIPYDYFMRHDMGVRQLNHFRDYLWFLLRNVLGMILVVFGISMLILPGQGVITIVLGLSLMSFPGKRELIRWILQRKSVRRTMNWIRRKAKKPPLVFDLNLTFKDMGVEQTD